MIGANGQLTDMLVHLPELGIVSAAVCIFKREACTSGSLWTFVSASVPFCFASAAAAWYC